MFKHYFEQIQNIEIWPIISLVIFFVFFSLTIVRIFFMDKKHIDKMKSLPLNEEEKPWFMALNLVNPHDIMFYDTDQPGKKSQGDPGPMMKINRDPSDKVYRKKWDLPLPPSRNEAIDTPGRPKAHSDFQQSKGLLTGVIPNEDDRWKRMQDYYCNCISDNDRSVETILTELDNLGMTDNTIVIMTADHGELCGAHGLSGKGGTAYREQNNVPLLVYHPDMPGGKRCKAVTSHLDLIPTILGMTGADREQALEFFAGLKELHTRRRQLRGEGGAFANSNWEQFHRQLILERFDAGEIQLLRVSNAHITIGYLYNLIWRKQVYVMQTGFCMSDDRRDQPGYVVHALAIAHNRDRGMSVYDLMHGDSLYKQILCGENRKMVWAVIQRPLLKFRVENGVVGLVRRVRGLMSQGTSD